MALPKLTSSDAGAAARDKINAGLTEAEKVAGKANASDVAAATATATAADARAQSAARMAPPSTHRPGDGVRAFTFVASLTALGGEADALAPLDGSKIAFAAAGGVVRLVGQGILAAREAEAIEPGRIREVRAAFRRRTNASDPSNDTVRAGLLWLDQAKNPLPGPAFAVVADLDTLTTSSGRQEVRAYVAASAGEGVTIVAPAGAAYFRRFVYNFGFDGTTDVETLAGTDVTDLAIPPTVTTDALNRIAAQESLNAGARLSAVEAAVQNPNSVTYPTLSDAQAESPPATATTIVLRGRDAVGDGLGRSFRRVATIAAGAVGFTAANGSRWQRIEGSAGALDLAVFGVGDANIFVSSAPYIPGADTLFAATTDRNGNPIQIDPKSPRQSAYWYGARNEIGVVGSPQDDTAAYQAAIDAARAARARNIPSRVDIGSGRPNLGSPLLRGNNLLFCGSLHDAVNNKIPGLGDLLAMSQALDIRQAAFDLPGNQGGGSANQWVDYVSAEILPSASLAAHEKAARLTIVNHADPSDWSSPTICTVPRDGVGHQIIVNANADLTRAYGQHIIVKSEPGVRTFGNCLELEWHNRAGDAFSERRQGTCATRSVIGCVAANGVITNGVAFVGSDYAETGKAGTYENAIFASYAALDNWLIKCGLTSPAATELDDWFSIHKSGAVTIGQSGLDPSGAAIWVHRSQNRPNAAGNQNAVIKLQADGDAQAYTTFVHTGQVAWSFGFDMGANIMALASQEGLGGNRILSASNKAVAIGGGAPQDCGASNVLFLSQAASPFASGNNPSGGAVVIFDGTNLIVKRPDGKIQILNNWQ